MSISENRIQTVINKTFNLCLSIKYIYVFKYITCLLAHDDIFLAFFIKQIKIIIQTLTFKCWTV